MSYKPHQAMLQPNHTAFYHLHPQKSKGDLPDTLDPQDFVNPPAEDRRCVKCHHVPTNPQRSSCCNTVYCPPCSRTKTYCVTHHGLVGYTDDKKLKRSIKDLRSRCPNWRGGCQFKDAVSKVYKQHLPECQIQDSGGITSHTQVYMPYPSISKN